MIVNYIGGKEGGLDKLKGKKIGFIYLDAPYGKEPIPLLEQLAKDYGFELKLYPVPAADMQNQSSHWLNVRRDRPDWIYHVGLGRDEPDGGQGSRQDQLSDGSFRSASGGPAAMTTRVRRAPAARAICRSTSIRSAPNFPVIQDIIKYVVDKGKSQTAEGQGRRESLQPRRLNSMLIAEAIRNAQKHHRQEGRQRRGRAARP